MGDVRSNGHSLDHHGTLLLDQALADERGRLGLPVQIALHLVASEQPKQAHLLFGLHALRVDAEIEIVRASAMIALMIAVEEGSARQSPNEGLVDLILSMGKFLR